MIFYLVGLTYVAASRNMPDYVACTIFTVDSAKNCGFFQVLIQKKIGCIFPVTIKLGTISTM